MLILAIDYELASQALSLYESLVLEREAITALIMLSVSWGKELLHWLKIIQ
jgi:hypothetical protein